MKKRRLFMGILAVIFLVCIVQAGRKLADDAARSREYEEAASIAGLPKRDGPVQAPPPPPDAPEVEETPLPEEVQALAAVDLPALREVNPEVVGWIEIPGTELSYPLLQHEDNEYYLNHTWTGASNSGGAIFLEKTSRADLSGFHTIAYGHRMRNGSMFGSLRDYRNNDYWQEHPSVYLAWDGGVYRYDIFSAHEASVTGLVYRLDLEQSGLEEDFLEACQAGSVLETGIVPSTEDRILTLSTCTGTGYSSRWVVHARLAQTYGAGE